jgi:hypothetical protein
MPIPYAAWTPATAGSRRQLCKVPAKLTFLGQLDLQKLQRAFAMELFMELSESQRSRQRGADRPTRQARAVGRIVENLKVGHALRDTHWFELAEWTSSGQCSSALA